MPLCLIHSAVAARLTNTVCPARKPWELLMVTTLDPIPTNSFVMLLEREALMWLLVPFPMFSTGRPLGILLRTNFVEETPEPLSTTLLLRSSPEEIRKVPFPSTTAPPPAAEASFKAAWMRAVWSPLDASKVTKVAMGDGRETSEEWYPAKLKSGRWLP